MLSYRNDLLRGDRVPLPSVHSTTLPRGIITKSESMMNELFNLLDSKDVHLQE
jgi:ubiquitin carboxyl-terminal hydrolase 34